MVGRTDAASIIAGRREKRQLNQSLNGARRPGGREAGTVSTVTDNRAARIRHRADA
jgi:hypothetical protein